MTVTYLPVVSCAECGREMAHRPGRAAEVLTEHYEREQHMPPRSG